MKKNVATESRFEKKSERLDIRVSHKKKQAFTKACDDQGDTPSNAVRRFITGYIRRAKRDDLGDVIRRFPWKPAGFTSVAIITFGFGGLLLTGYISQTKEARIADKVFNIYDENDNGLIELGEIAPNDFHLHRVLNIDGQDGISRDEFRTKAVMIWRFVDPASFEVVENNKGRFKQTSVTVSLVAIAHDSETKMSPHYPSQKKYIMVDGKPVELNDKDTLLKNINSIDVDYLEMRKHGGLPDFSAEHLKKYNMKTVQFDLRNPDKLELTIYERQNSGMVARSMNTFQRSVAWVEGRKTPEFVMGQGHEKAVLTNSIQEN